MNKKIYLTIDDSPSKHTSQKVDFLKKHQIPAVFFCRGEYIPQLKDQVVYAIQQGFLIGNHSYSHPYFSHLSLADCIGEIHMTETLIDDCYRQAGISRPCKIVRLPYGDRGTQETVPQIQKFLKDQQFVSIDFGASLPQNFIDAPWTWDTKDYKRTMIQDSDTYRQEMERHYQTSSLEEEVILLHDFERNHSLFEETMSFLLEKEVTFLPFNIKT